jgi:tRNA threonylcarbamoyladenosine biosynthesis protein TsaB
MNELAFDTATAACSVALRRADGETFTKIPPAARMFEQPAHTTELLAAIHELFHQAGLQLGEVDRVAVGIGPGAFTGLRIGVSTARAIATARGIGLTPVSSLAALSAGAADGAHLILPVIDARRSEFFFRAGQDDYLASPEDTVARAKKNLGHTAPQLAIGDGAVKLREQFETAGIEVAPSDDQRHVVSALAMLDLANAIEPQDPDAVVPNYIRPPDAKVSSRESWLVGAAAK